jgi:hypothetical protein
MLTATTWGGHRLVLVPKRYAPYVLLLLTSFTAGLVSFRETTLNVFSQPGLSLAYYGLM